MLHRNCSGSGTSQMECVPATAKCYLKGFSFSLSALTYDLVSSRSFCSRISRGICSVTLLYKNMVHALFIWRPGDGVCCSITWYPHTAVQLLHDPFYLFRLHNLSAWNFLFSYLLILFISRFLTLTMLPRVATRVKSLSLGLQHLAWMGDKICMQNFGAEINRKAAIWKRNQVDIRNWTGWIHCHMTMNVMTKASGSEKAVNTSTSWITINISTEDPKQWRSLIFEVLTAVKMSMFVFWVATPRWLVGGYQRFGGTYCLHLQDTSTLKTKASCSFETLVSVYRSTRRYNPEDQHRQWRTLFPQQFCSNAHIILRAFPVWVQISSKCAAWLDASHSRHAMKHATCC
jgi:hypothetical protein